MGIGCGHDQAERVTEVACQDGVVIICDDCCESDEDISFIPGEGMRFFGTISELVEFDDIATIVAEGGRYVLL